MEKAVLFKILQRKLKFRNPQHLVELNKEFIYTETEYTSANEYLHELRRNNINYSYPEKEDYPEEFLKMKEPPLFIEYSGAPLWKSNAFISVVGSREVQPLSEQWLKQQFSDFVVQSGVGVVSGGANGVDQLSHLIALKNNVPTIVVLPSGLLNLYPPTLNNFKPKEPCGNICFLTEFEIHQKLHRSHFFIRNRLIAALGKITLVVQATVKSGSMLTVHHCLEMGKPVSTIPAHPELCGFDGNLKLLHEGAYSVRNFKDLHEFWVAECWGN